MRDVAVAIDLVRNAAFEEAFLLQKRSRAFDVVVRREYACAYLGFIWTLPSRNQSHTWVEQRAEAIPIALLARRAGDHVVGGGEDRFDGAYVVFVCLSWGSRLRRRRRSRWSWCWRVGLRKSYRAREK